MGLAKEMLDPFSEWAVWEVVHISRAALLSSGREIVSDGPYSY